MVAEYKKQLAAIVKDVMGEIYAEYNEEVDRVIQSPNEFADLGFVGQDIVDTRRFLNSKVISTIEDTGRIVTEMTITWSPVSPENGFNYGPSLWKGYFAWGRKFIKGRKWDMRAVRNIQPVQLFAQKMNKRGIKTKVVFDQTSSLPS